MRPNYFQSANILQHELFSCNFDFRLFFVWTLHSALSVFFFNRYSAVLDRPLGHPVNLDIGLGVGCDRVVDGADGALLGAAVPHVAVARPGRRDVGVVAHDGAADHAGNLGGNGLCWGYQCT